MSTRVTDETREMGRALARHFGVGADEWLYGPSGFSVKGQPRPISRAAAMKLLGIKVAPKPKRPIEWGGSAGEWNRFVALVQAANKGTLPPK